MIPMVTLAHLVIIMADRSVLVPRYQKLIKGSPQSGSDLWTVHHEASGRFGCPQIVQKYLTTDVLAILGGKHHEVAVGTESTRPDGGRGFVCGDDSPSFTVPELGRLVSCSREHQCGVPLTMKGTK